MTVNELSMLEPLNEFRLAAGFDGIFRTVTNVGILEYESVDGRCESFSHGDFVLTTLFFAKEDPARIMDAVRLLVERDVAGLAVRTVYYQDLDQAVKDFADEHQFPIFLFEQISISDVLLYTYNILNAQKESAFYESKIRQMFPAPVPEAAVLQGITEINPSFQKDHYCAYLTPKTPSAALLVSRAVPQFQRRLDADKRYASLLRYEEGWLLLASFPARSAAPDQLSHLRSLLYRYGLEPASFFCGLSRIHHELKQFDISLREAFSANLMAQRRGVPLLRYEDLGVYQLLLPQLRSREFAEHFEAVCSTLREDDEKYHSDLLKTLRTYVACGGKLAQTAERLFLHVNTVRYRLNKIQELLHMEDFYPQAYLFVKAYDFYFPQEETL